MSKKTPSPLVHLRSVMAKVDGKCSQSDLARMLGVATITIGRIERGSLKLPRRLAQLIDWHTGAVIESGGSQCMSHYAGEVFDVEHYQEVKRLHRSESHAKSRMADLSNWMKVLQMAADTPEKAAQVIWLLSRAVENIGVQFNTELDSLLGNVPAAPFVRAHAMTLRRVFKIKKGRVDDEASSAVRRVRREVEIHSMMNRQKFRPDWNHPLSDDVRNPDISGNQTCTVYAKTDKRVRFMHWDGGEVVRIIKAR